MQTGKENERASWENLDRLAKQSGKIISNSRYEGVETKGVPKMVPRHSVAQDGPLNPTSHKEVLHFSHSLNPDGCHELLNTMCMTVWPLRTGHTKL